MLEHRFILIEDNVLHCIVHTRTLKRPKEPLYVNPLMATLRILVVAAAIPQQKKVCQANLLLQNDERSSIANSRPPNGALKAAATPAATPAVVKVRLWTVKDIHHKGSPAESSTNHQ